MSKKNIYILAGAALLILIGAFFLFGRSNGAFRYGWREHYRSESKDPYGTFLVRNLLAGYYPGEKFTSLDDSLNVDLDTGAFVSIGGAMWLDSAELNALLGFVKRGNKAFIACQYLPIELLDSLDQDECMSLSDPLDSTYFEGMEHFYNDTLAKLNYYHASIRDSAGYPCKFLYFHRTQRYNWTYFPTDLLCEGQTTFEPLGMLHPDSQYVNFVKADYGLGAFYLHTTPLAFTNYYLVNARGLEYAEKSFSHLQKGKIYWDGRTGGPSGGGGKQRAESPLKYILSQKELAWAWFILLALALLYLAFRAKRRQRVIPVLEQNTNSSLEFIGIIGRLAFLQNNHRQLALQKMKLFLNFVRDRYHLSTKEVNDQFAKMLVQRSEVGEELVGKILTLNRNINSSGYLSENTLVDFHRHLEQFYRECK